MTPAGAPGPSLNGWQWSSVPGPWWAELMRNISADPVSPFNAALQAAITAGWGTGQKLDISFYGNTYESGGNTVYGMPFNQVPGTTPLVSMTYGVYATSSDAGPVPYTNTTTIEGWPFAPSGAAFITGTVSVSGGSPTVTGSGTAFTTQVVAGDTYCFGTASPSVLYTVASTPVSDTSLTLTANYAGSNASGLVMNGPYNRPLNGTIEATMGDTRILALMRNESTGYPEMLYEDAYVYSNDNGATWNAEVGVKLNLATGAQRADGLTSTTAAGTPCMPFLVRYDEAASGAITHPLRGVIATGINLNNRCVWPALHAVNGLAGDYTQGILMMGARLRLNAGWLAANLSSFSAINQAILTAMNQYGLHIDDLTSGPPIWIDGSQDSRWSHNDLLNLKTVPVTAFEVIDTIKPQFTFTGPASGTTGSPLTYTVTYTGGGNTNFAAGIYIYRTTDDVTNTVVADEVLSNTTPGPLTFTWTPASPGNYLLWPSFSGVYWISAPNLSVAVSASSRSMTSIAAGRWDAWATWGAAPPTAGDSATVAHAVTMVGSVTLGTGAATTCLNVTSGTLTVVGCTLTLCGNATIGQTNGGTVVSRLNVLSSAGSQAGIVFNGSSGVTPTMTVEQDTQITFTGTPGCHTFLTTQSGTAGNPGCITDNGSGNRSFFMALTYCDASNLGSATTPGLQARAVNNATTPVNAPFTMANCTVNNCGIFPYCGGGDGTVNYSFTNSVWTNPLDTTQSAQVSFVPGASPTTGTGLVSGCLFYGAIAPLFNTPGWTITNNYFDDHFDANHSNTSWTSFDGNFIRKQTNRETITQGSVTNSYLLITPTGGVQGINGLFTSSFNSTFSGNVFHNTGTSGNADAIVNTEHPNQSYALTITNNIVIPGGGGDTSFLLGGITSNITDPGLGYGTCTSTIEHNTICVGNEIGMNFGNGVGSVAHSVAALKSNLFWRTGTVGNNYACSYTYGGTQIADVLPAASAAYNGWVDLATVPAGTWSSLSCTCQDGTVYNTPMSGATAPGAHDVANVSPAFVDTTRNLQTWDASLGGAGTVASALTRIQANTALTKSSLIPYIRAGFTPTASAYLNAGHDGANIGAV